MPTASQVPVCVSCRKTPVDPRWRPFCSQRCQLQDLGRWADGTYRVAAEPIEPAVEVSADDADTSELYWGARQVARSADDSD